MSKYARRVDDNHTEVARAAARLGAMVVDLSRAGGGVPDLLIGWRGLFLLVEVKDGDKPANKRKLRGKAQKDFHAECADRMLPCYVVESVDQLIELLGNVK